MNDEDFADMRELIDNLRIRIERLERVVHNLMNSNSPIITNPNHKTETLKGQFSFAPGAISPPRNGIGRSFDDIGLPSGDDGPGGGTT